MKRVLLIRLSALGDIVLTTVAVEALHENFPGAKIEFLVKARFAGLLEPDPRIHRLWSFDECGRHRGIRGLLAFMRDIQKEPFDLVVDLQDNLRSRFLCRGLRADRILRWDKETWQRRLLVAGHLGKSGLTPVYQRYLEALAPLGIDIGRYRPRLDLGQVEPTVGLESPFVAMAPGAYWPAKRWPTGHFVALAEIILQETECRVVLFGSSQDRDIGEQIKRVRPDRIANLCGEIDLVQLARYLALAEVLVTNDTGPMHLAEATGVPVLAFFGPTVRGFGFAPWRPESRVLEREMPCRPCSLHGRKACRRGGRCLADISPEEAWLTLREMLHG